MSLIKPMTPGVITSQEESSHEEIWTNEVKHGKDDIYKALGGQAHKQAGLTR